MKPSVWFGLYPLPHSCVAGGGALLLKCTETRRLLSTWPLRALRSSCCLNTEGHTASHAHCLGVRGAVWGAHTLLHSLFCHLSSWWTRFVTCDRGGLTLSPVSVVDLLCHLSAWWTRLVTCHSGGLRAVCDEALRSLWSSCSQPRRVFGDTPPSGSFHRTSGLPEPSSGFPAVAAVK